MSGLINKTSNFSVAETVQRLIKRIEEEKWHVFASIDHSKQARDKDLELRPTQVILFGNPQLGTLLMQDQQSTAIDLPVKALVWEDAEGNVKLTYNSVQWIKERHHLKDSTAVTKIGEFIEKVCLCACQE